MKNVCLPLNTLIKQQLEFQIGTKNTDFNMKFIAALALALSCYFRTTGKPVFTYKLITNAKQEKKYFLQ